MFLKSIHLENFRNYSSLTLQTNAKVNLFVGNNAQGKTNLLESIYVLALTKSHRTAKDKELIQWNEQHAQIQGEIDKKYGPLKLECTISSNRKKVKLNGLEQKKLSNYYGSMNVVMFAPEDLEIVKGSPGIRRRFLDMEIGQVRPGYLFSLSQYLKVIEQRNNYLKTAFATQINEQLLEVWDEQLSVHGTAMMFERQRFIQKLEKWAAQIHAGITNGQEQLSLEYQPSIPIDHEQQSVVIEQFMLKLKQNQSHDVRRGSTQIGPHRDDFSFFINGKEAQVYGSQGQQRTVALSLKLAELELIFEETGEYPILLLDDVLSELDQHRQTQLIETFQNKVQTFVTTTGVEAVDLAKLEDVQIYTVTDGSVQ